MGSHADDDRQVPAAPPIDPARLVAATPDLIVAVGADGALRFASERAREVLGWEPAEWMGRSALDVVHPDDWAGILGALETVTNKDVGLPIEARVATADGGWRWFELVGRNRLADPDLNVIVLCCRDATDRRKLELASDDARRFEAMLHYSPTVLVLADPNGMVAGASASLTRQLGHDPEVVLGRPVSDLVVAADAARFATVLADTHGGRRRVVEVGLRPADGGPARPFRVEIADLRDDPVVAGQILAAHDITELHAARRTLEHLAAHDLLTGLPNRRLLFERLDAALDADDPLGLLYVDLDGFKPINDLLGHGAGDELLVATARRLEAVAGPDRLVSRLGGDEFAVLVPDPDSAQELAEEVGRAIAEPFRLGAGVAHIAASVGVAVAHPGIRGDELLAQADHAMYQQKSSRQQRD